MPAVPMRADAAQPADAPGGGPSIAYLESMAHSGDHISFAPTSTRARSAGRIAAGERTAAAPSSLRPVALRRQVIGFLPYWELVDPTLRLDYSSLSTIAYFSAAATASGGISTREADGTTPSGWSGWNSQALTDIMDRAHANGVKVVFTLTLFAWTTSQANVQKALLDSPTARAALVRNLVRTVVDRGADGVNLDIEPLVRGREEELVSFVRDLRAAFDAVGPGYEITVDVLGSTENYPHEDLVAPGAADALFIMGYDYRTAGAAYAGSISPLTGPAYDLTDTLDTYLARVPASKVILGLPYYGRAWSTATDAVQARTLSGSEYGYSATANYDYIVEELIPGNGRRWDSEEQVPWTAYPNSRCPASTADCSHTFRQLYYDDAESLRLKYQLADSRDLLGVGIWALGYDGQHPELSALITEVFGGTAVDSTPPEAGLDVLPADAPDEGFIVAWTGADASGVASYDVQVAIAGGPWTDWLTGTSATSEVWLGADGLGYAFRVRATDTGGNTSDWSTTDARTAPTALARGGFARVVSGALAVRSAPTPSAARLATAKAGDVFLVTGGPRAASGYTWYQVTGPLSEWPAVGAVHEKAWIAVRKGKTVYASGTRRPSSTVVVAGFAGYAFDAGGAASLGPDAIARRTFSPLADGRRDALMIGWKGRAAMTGVTARILRPDGTLVGTIVLGARKAGTQAWSWDGRVSGSVVPDGQYIVELTGRSGSTAYHAPSDRPATPAQVDRFGVVVDTVAPTLAASAISATTFSPDGDGVDDTVVITGSSPDATAWEVVVAPVVGGIAGKPIRTISGAGSDASATWDGRTDAGKRVTDGTYRVTLRMLDAAGNAASATWDVTLDTPAPRVDATVTPASISPDGDGVADKATIRWTAEAPVSGTVRIARGSTVVRSWPQAAATAGTVTWDGNDAKGKAVPDGAYLVVLDLADAAGNPVLVELPLTVDRTVAAFSVAPAVFHPQDGDPLAPSTRISFRLTRPAATRLAIVDAAGAEVRVAWTDRAQQAGDVAWTWDGTAGGGPVAPGRYTVVLRATTDLGTLELRRAVVADAFDVRLSAATVRAGDSLTVTVVAAEPLRSAPGITLTQPGLAPAKGTVTSAGSGKWRATFTIGAGGTGQAVISVLGRDSGGGIERSRAMVSVE